MSIPAEINVTLKTRNCCFKIIKKSSRCLLLKLLYDCSRLKKKLMKYTNVVCIRIIIVSNTWKSRESMGVADSENSSDHEIMNRAYLPILKHIIYMI